MTQAPDTSQTTTPIPIRWTKAQKLATLRGIDTGTLKQADLDAWGVSDAEIAEWRAAVARYGAGALRATYTGIYRRRGREHG